jgi:hypothetical protein
MNPSRTFVLVHFVVVAFACSSPLTMAQTASTTTGTSTPAATTASPATASNPDSKLVASFTDLAGSQENATSLVNGLRTGSAITLVEPVPQTGPTPPGSTTATPTSITFSPGTKPMGYGNIRIALSLARTQLVSQGITNPTAEQLQGALMGTQAGATGTATQGVLQMRASGMGWGQIANSMGVNLGAVMSGKQALPATSPTTAAGTTATAGISTKTNSSVTQRSGSGVVTGTGITGTTGSAHGKSGVTTAAGGVTGGSKTQVTTGLGGGHASATGAVNASGGKVGAAGAMSNSGGNGKGKP